MAVLAKHRPHAFVASIRPGKGLGTMTELADVDYFTDADIAQDPYRYWD